MAEGIRVNEGWRRKALAEGIGDPVHRGVEPDNPAVQTAFDVVCAECRDLLPCGSTLAVASGHALEQSARWAGLEREDFRLAVRCLRYTGVLYELPHVRSERKGLLLGVPAEYGALEAYDYRAHDGTLEVSRRGKMYPRLVATFGVAGGVVDDHRSPQSRGDDYRLNCEEEVRALYALGLKIAPALVHAYGPARCRQVRRWATRRAGKKVSAGLVFSALVKYPPILGGEFDAEAVRQDMAHDLHLDEAWRIRHTV